MNLPKHLKIELKDGVADQYIRYTKTKAEVLIIERLCDLLESIKHPEDEKFIDSFKWTTLCIWQAIYINYHKLYSEPMKSENGQKVNKFQINADEFLKIAPKNLIQLHDKILSVRHHFFVHGGTEMYESYQLIADIIINQNGTRIQLNVEGIKEPLIDNYDVQSLRELLAHLMTIIENKLSKCNEKLSNALHKAVEQY